jgi:hypothetical protein
MANAKMLSSEKELISAIQNFTKKLEIEQVYKPVTDIFLSECENFVKLPSKSDSKLIDSFLISLISIVSINIDSDSTLRALDLLFSYLKNDPQVYVRFRPDRNVILRMNLDSFVNAQDEDTSNLALNFTSFLLRYHKELDYADFSHEPEVIKKVQRAEMYRNWVDIEDLANGYETLQKNFNGHKDTSSKAFQEILTLVEGVKDELLDKSNEIHNDFVNMKGEQDLLQKRTGT